jgi:hypothetical protein
MLRVATGPPSGVLHAGTRLQDQLEQLVEMFPAQLPDEVH